MWDVTVFPPKREISSWDLVISKSDGWDRWTSLWSEGYEGDDDEEKELFHTNGLWIVCMNAIYLEPLIYNLSLTNRDVPILCK